MWFFKVQHVDALADRTELSLSFEMLSKIFWKLLCYNIIQNQIIQNYKINLINFVVEAVQNVLDENCCHPAELRKG